MENLIKATKINVTLSGLAPIMFDRFFDHSAEQRPPEQKLYLSEDNKVVLPSSNIIAFLFGEYPAGCAKTFEGKKAKNYMNMGQGHVHIDPVIIPFFEAGNEIVFNGFGDKFYINMEVPRTKKGSMSIKQPNSGRPAMTLPWELIFNVTLIENALINETKLFNWFTQGGILIGLGNYRPRHGRFVISKWEVEG